MWRGGAGSKCITPPHSKVIAAYRETPIKSLTWWAGPKFVQTWKYNFLLCFGNEPPIWYNGLNFTNSHRLRYNHTWCVHWTRIGHLVLKTYLFHAPDCIMSCMSHALWIACSNSKYWMAWVIVACVTLWRHTEESSYAMLCNCNCNESSNILSSFTNQMF